MLATPSIRAKIELLTTLGNQSLSQAVNTGRNSDYTKAIQEFSTAYKFALLLNAKDGTQERCCFNLGAAHVAGGDPERGIALLETVLEFPNYRIQDAEKNFKTYKGEVHYNLGVGHEKLQHSEKAVESFNAALLEYDRQDNPKRTCETYLKIANVHNVKQDFAEARRNYQNASKIYWKAKEPGNSLMARICEANAAYKDKTYNREEIVKLLDSIVKDYSQVKSKNFQGKILCEVGLLYSMLGRYDSALYCFIESIKLCDRISNLQRLAIALQNAGSILNRLGYYKEAIPKHFQAARLHGLLQNRNNQGQSFFNLAMAQNELGRFEDAWESFLHALKAFEDTDDKNGQWKCQERLGILMLGQGRSMKAIGHFRAALALLPPRANDAIRERIQSELSKSLKSARTQPEEEPVKTITNAPALAEKSAPYVNGDVVDSGKEKGKPQRRKHTKLERGRRDYSDENDRPIQHVARGMSNLTNVTVQSLRRESSDEESTTSSDSDDTFSDSNQQAVRSLSADGSVADRRKLMKKRKHKKQFHKLVEATTMPINTITSRREEDQRPREVDDDESQELDDTTELNRQLKRQLVNIPEASSEDEDFTDISLSHSSLSSDSVLERTTPKEVYGGKDESRHANDTLPGMPTSTEPSNRGTRSLGSTHLYATVQKSSKTNGNSEPGESQRDGGPKNSDAALPVSLSTAPPDPQSTLEFDEQLTDVKESSSTNADTPHTPEVPPRTHKSKKAQKQKKSTACIIL